MSNNYTFLFKYGKHQSCEYFIFAEADDWHLNSLLSSLVSCLDSKPSLKPPKNWGKHIITVISSFM